jgi:zinc finger SWIM domain-containing protein 3
VVAKYAEMAPKVGMNFDCEEKAYETYNTYAGLAGFSIRKSRTKRRKSDDSLSQKYFVCSVQGHRKNEASQMDITRTGCDARV